jgi:hypothetical protein
MGPRAHLAAVAREKILIFRESNPGCPARNLVIILSELWRVLLSSVIYTNVYRESKMDEDDTDGTCSTHGEERKYIQSFSRNNTAGRTILKCIFRDKVCHVY